MIFPKIGKNKPGVLSNNTILECDELVIKHLEVKARVNKSHFSCK